MGLFNHFPYPDTHQLNLDWILDAVKGCVDKVAELWTYVSEQGGRIQQAVTDAQTAATTAQTSAQSAQASVTSAQNAANTAQTSAQSAQDAANTAKTSAQSAQASATSAQASATELKSLFFKNAGAHNSFYRGKSLGSTVTTAQYATIKAGTFNDLYIGDYWTIGGINYCIAAFDYYLNSGDVNCTTHHVDIVPDTCLYNAHMHNTSSGSWESGAANTTDGGYVGSDMYKSNLEQAKTTIKSAFSGHVLKHRIYLTNAVANGRASSCEWYDSEVDLMREQMVYGSGILSPVSDGINVPANYRVEKSQLPLFQHEPSRICNRETWWLRDVITASGFAIVNDGGTADCLGASYSCGVRPAFCIS